MISIQHHYVDRETGTIRREPLFWDTAIQFIYSEAREKAPALFQALTGAHASRLLAFINFDLPAAPFLRSFASNGETESDESLDPPGKINTAREFFQRKIRYWERRPMLPDDDAVVSPADSKIVVGSLLENSALFLKRKFFDLDELLGEDKSSWISAFRGGDFAVFRLTPEKYHYNHTPVAGRVADFYAVEGRRHSCNPSAMIALASPCSKNKRFVTIIDTDVPFGSHVGLVAMIEVVALMIGDVVQVYSEDRYDEPRPVSVGMFLKKGVPKSLYRPGSSTDVLLFQRGRVKFADDLLENVRRTDVQSRFSFGFGQPLVETDLKVRSLIATAIRNDAPEAVAQRNAIPDK